MAKSDWKQISKGIFVVFSSYIGCLAIAMSILYGVLDLALGAGFRPRIITIFILGVGLIVAGYWVIHGKLSTEERIAFIGERLMWSLMLMSIVLLVRFVFVLFHQVPREKISTLGIEVFLMMLGLAILIVGFSISRSSIMRKWFLRPRRLRG